MTLTVIVVLIILLLMTLILFFLLKKEVEDINNKSKVYFTRKAQEYTDQINRNDETQAVDLKVSNENNKENNESESSATSIIYLEKKANYEIDNLLKMMKQIDKSFDLDNVQMIKSFLHDNVKKDKDLINKYNDLQKMKKYIEKIGILNIITNDDEDFINRIVNDLRLINDDVFMEYYSGKESFDVEEFCNYLDYEIGKCDPTIYVYVGDEDINYDMLDKHIKTIYSKDIYKGIKIVYLNKLYDFSLS